jgi:hypothetical protein
MASIGARGLEERAGWRSGRRSALSVVFGTWGLAVYDRRVVATLVIRLLGPPAIERDGGVVTAPRGHKAWAVLA